MKLKYHFIKNPARVSVAGYALFIMVGAFLLMLPISVRGEGIGFINALFTATSAACVTGLTVMDTCNDFSVFGQAVILALFQIGGLGIMTLSTLLLIAAGIRPGMTSRTVIQDALNLEGNIDFRTILKDVVLFTFVIEGVGAIS